MHVTRDHFVEGPDSVADFTDSDSSSVIRMVPDGVDVKYQQKQDKAFHAALISTLRKEAEGAMSSYLFYDLVSGDPQAKILSGGYAWERRMQENAVAAASRNGNNFGSNDARIIQQGLDEGLTDLLPEKAWFMSYGGGDARAFSA